MTFYRKKTFRLKRKVFYFLRNKFENISRYEDKISDIPLDVVIACIPKDLITLATVITGIRENVNHPIKEIYLVSPSGGKLKEFAKVNDCKFVDENSVLGYGKDRIQYYYKGLDRSGWLFQQLLKLAGNIGECENFITVDADTVMIRPHTFLYEGKPIFYESNENYAPYYDYYYKLFGYHKTHPYSFIAHFTVFNKNFLKDMKREILEKRKKEWDEVMIADVDENELSFCAENETYPNWVHRNRRCLCGLNFNLSLQRDRLEDYFVLKEKYHKKYKSISFHSWNE